MISNSLIMKATLFYLMVSTSFCLAGIPDIHVEVFSAKTADVNSFVFFDSLGSLIVDATRNSEDAAEVAKLARSRGSRPSILFITHAHPDHYLGMGALKKEFPELRILVASKQIKDDIMSFAEVAAENNWLSDEPQMRPKSKKNPNGFDYANEIQVLRGKTLQLPAGAKLALLNELPPTEAKFETLLFSKDLNALFASDLVYNGVHLWLGRDVDAKAIGNWQAELKNLKRRYAGRDIKVYPGHGNPTDLTVVDIDLKYIDSFIEAIKNAKTQEDAKVAIMKNYPTWKNSDFILVQSIKTQFENLNRNLKKE